MSTSQTYAVSGMTCGHCVSAVSEEISRLPGVQEVTVDLVAGGASRVHVSSVATRDEAKVREAVDEAGYQLVAGPA